MTIPDLWKLVQRLVLVEDKVERLEARIAEFETRERLRLDRCRCELDRRNGLVAEVQARGAMPWERQGE